MSIVSKYNLTADEEIYLASDHLIFKVKIIDVNSQTDMLVVESISGVNPENLVFVGRNLDFLTEFERKWYSIPTKTK